MLKSELQLQRWFSALFLGCRPCSTLLLLQPPTAAAAAAAGWELSLLLPAQLGFPSWLIPVPPGQRSAHSTCECSLLRLPDALEQRGEEEEPSCQVGWDRGLGHC